MISAVELAPLTGIAMACAGLGVSRATFYRVRRGPQVRPMVVRVAPRSRSPWALSQAERGIISGLLHAPEYVDLSAHTVYARLLDAGRYLASVSTFYRILRAGGEARPRRNQRIHPAYAKPELLATGPRQVGVLPPVRHLGCVQSLCCGLDARRTRIGRARQAVDRRHL